MTEATMTIRPAKGLWVIRAGGAVLGETRAALMVNEIGHAPVVYFPREDAGTPFLERSGTVTECPRKGVATYYSIIAKSGPIRDAAWSYEDPLPEAEAIRGYIAFDPEKATIEQL